MFDKIFKIALVILAVLFLLRLNSQNGRYQDVRPRQDDIATQILDTRTGLMYVLRAAENEPMTWVICDPAKGTIQYTKANEKDLK